MKHFVVAAVILWLLAIAGISTANAAQLTVNSATQASAYTLSKCANANLASAVGGPSTAGAYTQVTISSIPTQCQGLLLEIAVLNASGTVLATGSATPAAASVVVTTGSYTGANVTTVVARIDGWVFPTTWTAPVAPTGPAFMCQAVNNGGQIPNGQTCTVSNVSVSTYTSNGFQYANVSMTINSSQSNALVTLDLSQAPFPGWTPASITSNGDFVRATRPTEFAYSCASLPQLRLNRNLNNSSWTVSFQMTTQPNAYPWASGPQRVCP